MVLDRHAQDRSRRGTIAAMYAGLGLTVVAAIVPFFARPLLADHIRAGYPYYPQARIDSAVSTYLVILSVIAVSGVIAWLWTARAVKVGKRWARPTATMMFLLGTSIALTGLLTEDTSGDTGLPPLFGWLTMLPCLAGLLAILLLWTRPHTA